MTAAAGLISWWGICLLYIRFHKGMKVQGIDRKTLPYWSYLNTHSIAAWYAIIAISIILFFSGFSVFLTDSWSTSDFVTTYFPLWFFPTLWLGYRLVTRCKFIAAEKMDFFSGLAQIEAECYDEPPPRNIIEKVWQGLM
jgi:amino acid transporter